MQPTDDITQVTPAPRRPAWVGWGAAVTLVLLAWVAACSIRDGGHTPLPGWQDGIQAGQGQATELDRPMIIMFTADWCGPCQQLKRNILTQTDVEAVLMSEFVPVIEDMTQASASDPRIRDYRIEGYPTLIVMSADGQEIQRVSGTGVGPVASVDTFKAWLAEAQQ